MSTTKIGDNFRDAVASLLRSAGFTVHSEWRVGSKKADLYYEETRRGKLWRVAVETKNYESALIRSDLVKIHSEYSDALRENEIHELLIVSNKKITSADANKYLSNTPTLSHLTLADLQEDLLNFEPLLSFFQIKYEQEGLVHHFVRPLSIENQDIIEYISSWLNDENYDPIAIIAGYGMGKTSLARHLTYILASEFLVGNQITRTPVLINLAGISREQGVEGLIGTALTGSQPAVRGYVYPLFDLLNTAGRFVIILDGFDEMKHMMTEGEFKATFQEMNRLVNGKAKLIILGRPAVFLSDNEQMFVLRGVRKVAHQLMKIPGAPRYQEIKLRPFSPDQVKKFLSEYFRIRSTEEFANKRIAELDSSENDNLLSRPVHAKMFAELAADENFIISRLSRFDLYDHFVSLLIEREGAKLGRGNLLKDVDRREFSCDLAWYLWTQSPGDAIGCRLEDLPDELFARYLPLTEDPISLRRALLSGSFLDEKSGGIFFFAHRSFQEFLVSEYIFSNLSEDEEGKNIIKSLPNALTPEVYDFIIERGSAEFFDGLLHMLDVVSASVPRDTFDILISSRVIGELASSKRAAALTGWAASIWIGRMFTYDDCTPADILSAVNIIGVRAAQDPTVTVSAVHTLLHMENVSRQEGSIIVQSIIRLMFPESNDNTMQRYLHDLKYNRQTDDIPINQMEKFISAIINTDGELFIQLDCGALLELLSGRPNPISYDYSVRSKIRFRASVDVFFEHLSQNKREILREFYLLEALGSAKKLEKSFKKLC